MAGMIGFAVAAAAVTAGTAAPPAPVDVVRGERILAEARAACGGAAWDRVAGWHERGRIATAGGGGSYEEWAAMSRPAMALRTEVPGAPLSHIGVDGATAWRVLPGGAIDAGPPAGPARPHRRDAYLSNFGYLQPQRFPATVVAGDARTMGGVVYDIVAVRPTATEDFELWVDRASHHVGRIVVGGQIAEFRDYRTVAGVCAPMSVIQTDGNPAHTTTLTVETVEAVAVPAAVFAPPRP